MTFFLIDNKMLQVAMKKHLKKSQSSIELATISKEPTSTEVPSTSREITLSLARISVEEPSPVTTTVSLTLSFFV